MNRERRRLLLLGGAALALGTAMGVSVGVGRTGSAQAAPLGCSVPPREPAPFAPPATDVGWSAAPGPISTEIAATGGGFGYAVGGQPTTIRGMGYNPAIDGRTSGIPLAQRRERLQRDFPLMATAGVNTVIGWNPALLDGVALDAAQEAGLGVALPFDVDFTMDVLSSAARSAFTSAVLAWVEQYKQHPALRIWALGNEVLQRSVPPAWCSQPPTDDEAAWSAAWSSLLLRTADAIHARDPLHPVLYREAEDAYTPWLARAIEATPGDRPWLIYGVNAYTPRLEEILQTWPDRRIPTSLLVSEFAPLNAPRGQRDAAFRDIWAVIRSYSSYVLGGSVYVWSTDGPETVDQQFGLVDERGVPVDGTLDVISELYTTTAQSDIPADGSQAT